MSNLIVRIMDPEIWYLVEEFCQSEGIACPHVDFAHVVAAIDLDEGKVIGIAAAQMQVHTEPIWIKKGYQGKGIWQEMANKLEWYLDMRALQGGTTVGVWCQPTNSAAERICRIRGFQKCEKPLWTKVYDGSGLLAAGEKLIEQFERKE